MHSNRALGEHKFLILLADFPDVTRKYPETTLKNRIPAFLPGYFRDASYGLLELKADTTKRYMLPNPVTSYKISPANLEVDPRRVSALVTDAVNAADSDVQFSEDLYIILALGSTHEEFGMIGLCATPGMLGWQTSSAIKTRSGESVNNVAIFCENAHLGTYVHDTTHMLGGVVNNKRMAPCLYDHDLQAKYLGIDNWPKVLINMGYWDPLSSHAPYKFELPPSGFSSWTKMRLGWIGPSRLAAVNPGQDATIRLDPLADVNSTTVAIKIPLTSNTYYLIENRQKVGSDVNLPTSGVLILYADDTVDECRRGKAPVKIMDANPDIPYLNDATYDMTRKRVFIDSARNLAIVLLQKVGQSYDIRVTTPDKAGNL